MEIIGEGEYGQVYKGLYQAEEGKAQPVALKVLNEVNDRQAQSFLKEANHMMTLDHQFLIRNLGPVVYFVLTMI